MVSQGWAGGEEGIDLQGQASPKGVPAIEVREDGQMGARPSMRTVHKVGSGTIGTEDARVAGCDRR